MHSRALSAAARPPAVAGHASSASVARGVSMRRATSTDAVTPLPSRHVTSSSSSRPCRQVRVCCTNRVAAGRTPGARGDRHGERGSPDAGNGVDAARRALDRSVVSARVLRQSARLDTRAKKPRSVPQGASPPRPPGHLRRSAWIQDTRRAWICLPSASRTRGTRTVSTPFLSVAFACSRSMPELSRTWHKKSAGASAERP